MIHAAEIFNQHRSLVFGIAYRMLGTVTEAEDAVQETYLRWQRAADGDVRSPRAFLSATVTRLCIDTLRSARARREEYVGPWLPEPIPTDPAAGVETRLERSETLTMAFLILLESLNPVERAVFLLREVFDYEYEEVARVVGKSEANCRQIAHRARDYIAAHRPRFEPSADQREQLTRQFVRACNEGDLPGLIALLDRDITLWSDGGGKVLAARNPIYGAEKVGRFLLGLQKKFGAGRTFHPVEVNGEPGLMVLINGCLANVTVLEMRDGRIANLRIMVNPEKLGPFRELAEQDRPVQS